MFRFGSYFSGLVATAFVAASVGVAPPQHAQSQSPDSPQEITAEIGRPFISEVAPFAAPNAPAWVEIGIESLLKNTIYLPMVQKGEGSGLASAAPNAATAGVNLAGYRLSDEDGNSYALPAALPPVPLNGMVVVVLGAGTDDMDFSDGLATLYATSLPTRTFEAAGDQLTLYASNPSTQTVDFVAWGSPPLTDANRAIDAKLWSAGRFVSFDEGFGGEGSPTPIKPNESVGRWQGEWGSYDAAHSTRGKPNPMPAPMNSTVPDGAILEANSFGIAWSATDTAVRYEFELASTPEFTAPLISLTTDQTGWSPDAPLANGLYYWRVRGIDDQGRKSGYLGPMRVQHAPALDLATILTKTLLTNAQYRIQRKDTPMLDIGGGPNNIKDGLPIGSTRTGLRTRWDGPHIFENGKPSYSTASGLDGMYCARASAAMMTAFYGGKVSLDRMAYYRFEEWPGDAENAPSPEQDVPEHDLGYNKGMTPRFSLQWALRITDTELLGIGSCPVVDGYTCKNPNDPPIAFATIRNYIDDNRPFMSVNLNGRHVRVVDGYAIHPNGQQYVHLLDPAPSGCTDTKCTGVKWLTYENFRDSHEGRLVLSASATPNPRTEEATIYLDSDGDGMSDFDETVRFKTNPKDKDTDNDGVNDKEDIAEYVFDGNGVYNKRPADLGYNADFPNYGEPVLFGDETIRKELDPDNDNDGSPDGCEDHNANGKRDFAPGVFATETDNFSPTSKGVCAPKLNLVSPMKSSPASIASKDNPNPIGVVVQLSFPDALANPPTLKPLTTDFVVLIGDKLALVQTVSYANGQATLQIKPPAQDAPGAYKLDVTYDGHERHIEDGAVIYAS